MLRGRRSLQVRVKLFRVLALLAEWLMTLSMTSQGSEGDEGIVGEFEGVRRSETTKGAMGNEGRKGAQGKGPRTMKRCAPRFRRVLISQHRFIVETMWSTRTVNYTHPRHKYSLGQHRN